ncbi:hypothetical protein [Cryobacterium tagatosivorans]|uniref:Uncharacterized protein n=1 Tax=Cryobacterium tagatosivorans TaxID=1259199 RepID=A0A4R8UEK6_9MICO|nr:hypothetical protein [Cryobacterium tagatosivorans]TFB51949.1 hypothetical protein E3O23_07115 [Cryobacterium tagatosivorans]
MLTRPLQPGYDYLLGRKFSSVWREIGGTPLENDVVAFTTAARGQGCSERVTSAMASQIVLRLLIGSGRPLDDLTTTDFDDLASACVARDECTGASWAHYRDTMPATRQGLFRLGILSDVDGDVFASVTMPTCWQGFDVVF